MTNSANTYKVSSAGSTLPGFDTVSVVDAVGKLFGIPVDKAQRYVEVEKLIKRGLSSKDAQIYEFKLTSIGLSVLVVDEAANDSALAMVIDETVEKVSDTVSDDTEDPAPSDPAQASDEFACPKCRTLQPESEECIGCGLIFSKYVLPREMMKRRREARSGKDNGRVSSATVDNGSRFSALTKGVAVLVVVAVAGWVMMDGAPTSSDGSKVVAGHRFNPQGQVPENVDLIMSKSGVDNFISGFGKHQHAHIAENFPDVAKRRGVSESAIASAQEIAAGVFHNDALNVVVGTWLASKFSEQEVEQLGRLYSAPSVQRAVEEDSAPEPTEAELQAFVQVLENKPLSAQRMTSLRDLVDIQDVVENMLSLRKEMDFSIINMAAPLVKNRDTLKEQQLTQAQRDDVTDMLERARPTAEQQALIHAAYLYQDYSGFELEMLRKALDKPLIRKMNNELIHALENYYYKADTWYETQIRNAG